MDTYIEFDLAEKVHFFCSTVQSITTINPSVGISMDRSNVVIEFMYINDVGIIFN